MVDILLMVFDHLLDNRGQSFMLLVLFLLKKTLFYVGGRLGVVVLEKNTVLCCSINCIIQ